MGHVVGIRHAAVPPLIIGKPREHTDRSGRVGNDRLYRLFVIEDELQPFGQILAFAAAAGHRNGQQQGNHAHKAPARANSSCKNGADHIANDDPKLPAKPVFPICRPSVFHYPVPDAVTDRTPKWSKPMTFSDHQYPAFSDSAVAVLNRRYLKRDPETGLPSETPDDMFRRVAEDLAQADVDYGADATQVTRTAETFYGIMRRLEFLPNSPTLMNAGRPLQQLSACFVLPVDDSLDSIFDKVKETALIHKSGGGTGFAFSRLRPQGDTVKSTAGVASGPTSFIRAFDTGTDVVKQGGTRRGANMAVLSCYHPDIMEFVNAKNDFQNLQNFNISVGVDAAFMHAAANRLDYDLINPRNGTPQGQANAGEVFDAITRNAWLTGDPGILFLDRINADNPNPQLGQIEATNPCVTADTWVLTDQGPRQVHELNGVPFRGVHKTGYYPSTNAGFFATGRKPVFRLETYSGHQVTLTADHKVLTRYDAWKEAQSLRDGEFLLISDWPDMDGGEPSTQTNPPPAIPHTDPHRQSREWQRLYCRSLISESRRHADYLDHRLAMFVPIPDPQLRQDLQDILLRFKIIALREPNGLRIHHSNLERLRHCVMNDEPLDNHPLDEPFQLQFKKLVPVGEAEVYDCSIPAVQEFVGNGFRLHNCGEQPLLPYESCNLGSINLLRMLTEDDQPTLDTEKLARTARAAVHMLDNVIDRNHYPLDAIRTMTMDTRRIGVGVMGWADALIRMGIPYDSEQALRVGETVMAQVRQAVHQASQDMAAERGAFPEWERSVYTVPMRNSAPTTIAPTGTISIIAGVSSGIEPLFALAYTRNVMDNTRLPEVNEAFRQAAQQAGFYTDDLMHRIAEVGHIPADDPVPDEIRRVFRTSHQIGPYHHVAMQSAFQKHTDNAVSKTINFAESATVDDIATAYRMAWDNGCKGITVYRDGSKDSQVLTAGASAPPAPAADTSTLPAVKRARPKEVSGTTYRIQTGHGNAYITVNADEAGKPLEVFANIGKAGACDDVVMHSLTRIISLALRSNIPVEEIIDQIRGNTCCPVWDQGELVKSAPDAVGVALEAALGIRPAHTDAEMAQLPSLPNVRNRRRCPSCNGWAHFQSGCLVCISCGWSQC